MRVVVHGLVGRWALYCPDGQLCQRLSQHSHQGVWVQWGCSAGRVPCRAARATAFQVLCLLALMRSCRGCVRQQGLCARQQGLCVRRQGLCVRQQGLCVRQQGWCGRQQGHLPRLSHQGTAVISHHWVLQRHGTLMVPCA
jgi:hypothetical protein